ncbi:unannotated protein [freshwater metagenome]|uniref:Unannotated protein n=1 Tax=freshwater metagenome TaxID=449393 RepID=A0A6J6UCB6_9ZZZZ
MQLGCKPPSGLCCKLWVNREARCKHFAACLACHAQLVECWPWALWVHVVGSNGGDASPVVDARVEQNTEIVAQVWRCLQVNAWGKQYASRSDRPHVLVMWARCFVLHAGAWLGQEVLHDYFLHVAVSRMRLGNCHQCVDAIFARLANAHQDSCGERNLQLACPFQCVEASLRHFVGRATMAFQIVAQRFNHHSLRRRHRTKHLQFVAVQSACVCVRQQTSFVQHQLSHVVQVVNCRVVAVVGKPLLCNVVSQLWSFAQCEERFVAAGARALLGYCQHLFGRHVWVL